MAFKMADQIDSFHEIEVKRLPDHRLVPERFFCGGTVRFQYHLNGFLKIGSRFIKFVPLHVCARQVLSLSL